VVGSIWAYGIRFITIYQWMDCVNDIKFLPSLKSAEYPGCGSIMLPRHNPTGSWCFDPKKYPEPTCSSSL
jgi:hypothetical protein